MKFKELQKKEEKDLHKILQELREQYHEMRFKVANNQLKNIREVRQVKKDIARILLLLNTKRLNSAKPESEKTGTKPVEGTVK